MRICIFLLLSILTAVPEGSAQISNPVLDFPGVKSRRDVPGLLMARRPFVGEFHFDRLPSPLEASTVTFTVEVFEPKSAHPGGDLRTSYLMTKGAPARAVGDSATDTWALHVLHDPSSVRILGDTLFYWPGPHQPGDRFSGSFQIVPLRTMLAGFTLATSGADAGGLRVEWCLDYWGQLEFLGKGEENATARYFGDGPTFFSPAMVQLVKYSDHLLPNQMSHEIEIAPPFRIGDTSTVRLSVTAQRDYRDGFRSQFSLNHFDLVGSPPMIFGPLLQGETATAEFRLVPKPVANVHGFLLVLIPAEGGSGNPIRVDALFNADGSLWLVDDQTLEYIDRKHWPPHLPIVQDWMAPDVDIHPDGSRARRGGPLEHE